MTPGRWPVMEMAGIGRLIGWQSTPAPADRGHAAQTCPPKHTELRSLAELRTRWRTSAIRSFGACTVYRLAERARAAAATVWAPVRPVVVIALAAIGVVAVVYVMRGAFARHHLLGEAHRLSYVLRGRPHQRVDEQIVQTVVDDYTGPDGRRMMTVDLRALYPRDTEDRAVLRPLTRNRTALLYERARLAVEALAARLHAVRRANRLGSRTRPLPVSVPAASSPRPGPLRTGREAGRLLEPETGVDTVEQIHRTLEAAAELQDGIRERAVTFAPGRGPPPRRLHSRTPNALAPSTHRIRLPGGVV
ncbi:hypothetical protein [Streptomyces lavenduligriseus]|uniref:hypothetical protein n=1 Tax=Streptomyces lavenduligriseus TaxID=67315 RepID=UPI0027E22CFD|nr:hypothetical protein [Streptomyces lavenduligriseus]